MLMTLPDHTREPALEMRWRIPASEPLWVSADNVSARSWQIWSEAIAAWPEAAVLRGLKPGHYPNGYGRQRRELLPFDLQADPWPLSLAWERAGGRTERLTPTGDLESHLMSFGAIIRGVVLQGDHSSRRWVVPTRHLPLVMRGEIHGILGRPDLPVCVRSRESGHALIHLQPLGMPERNRTALAMVSSC